MSKSMLSFHPTGSQALKVVNTALITGLLPGVALSSWGAAPMHQGWGCDGVGAGPEPL